MNTQALMWCLKAYDSYIRWFLSTCLNAILYSIPIITRLSYNTQCNVYKITLGTGIFDSWFWHNLIKDWTCFQISRHNSPSILCTMLVYWQTILCLYPWNCGCLAFFRNNCKFCICTKYLPLLYKPDINYSIAIVESWLSIHSIIFTFIGIFYFGKPSFCASFVSIHFGSWLTKPDIRSANQGSVFI